MIKINIYSKRTNMTKSHHSKVHFEWKTSCIFLEKIKDGQFSSYSCRYEAKSKKVVQLWYSLSTTSYWLTPIKNIEYLHCIVVQCNAVVQFVLQEYCNCKLLLLFTIYFLKMFLFFILFSQIRIIQKTRILCIFSVLPFHLILIADIFIYFH